ncbi:Hypothetical protein NTJ_04083 [Nesidiocoris tenuis]|uniref:Uncharacterized protein n=1 Tax=Nesidiocoris tenuis TaxID=355587 RepID=A0ABN7AK61_9HEMI|nr:Hypothetical protein NTJ_04083 [Nesidiocoris tenuis]
MTTPTSVLSSCLPTSTTNIAAYRHSPTAVYGRKEKRKGSQVQTLDEMTWTSVTLIMPNAVTRAAQSPTSISDSPPCHTFPSPRPLKSPDRVTRRLIAATPPISSQP